MRRFLFGAAVCLVTALAVTYATVGGQYSVNIHFVPPLVTGTCSVAQFWSPPNVTCALCFCMTGTLSRCIPQPGCVPSNSTSSTTAAPPSNSSTTTANSTAANVAPTQATMTVTPSTMPTTQAGEATTLPPVVSNLVRKRRGDGKLGKP